MPPKKKVKTTPPGEVRTTRASAKKSGAEIVAPPPPATSTNAANGRRKRTAATMDADMEVEPTVEAVKIPTLAKKIAEPKKKVPKRSAAEKLFYIYADEETGQLNPESAQKWMADLGVHPESAFFYLVMYKCKAATPMCITKEEFTKFMNSIKVKTNDQFLSKLPALLDAHRPRSQPNPEFGRFYKWCFQHFRPENAKNIDVDIAAELFKVLLDEARYKVDWKSGEAVARGNPTPGIYPHIDAFVEFITTEPRPVAVITKDHFDQFYQFNLTVSWDLNKYSEESAWPALIDEYVTWKNEKYPVPKTSIVQVLDVAKGMDAA